jgi:hypothetical protein
MDNKIRYQKILLQISNNARIFIVNRQHRVGDFH